jgi:NET1-associated nuclear protein 1 (U3 small nucleolar RNA-associated protein 17)
MVEIADGTVFWSTRSTFSYRGMQIHASSFSPDGTIVALVHGPVVTLWDVESNVMLRVLDAGRQVNKCLFVGDRYLVAAGEGLVVWDLLSCQGTSDSCLVTISFTDLQSSGPLQPRSTRSSLTTRPSRLPRVLRTKPPSTSFTPPAPPPHHRQSPFHSSRS